MIEAVVFDWAGTVIDFGSRAPENAFRAVFEAQGVPISLEEARGPMGMEKREHIRTLCREPRIEAAWIAEHGNTADEVKIDEMYQQLTPLTRAQIDMHTDLVPGALETMENLRERGCKIGSTTGYGRTMIDGLVSEAARQGYQPDCVVAADEIASPRPAATGALLNLVKFGANAVHHCVKVDDTAPGIAEGLNAGMWTVGVAISGNAVALKYDEWSALSATEQDELRQKAYAKLEQTGAHYIIDSVADLPGILDDIEKRIAQGEKP